MSLRIEPLEAGDQRLSRFSCGNAHLDMWLREHAVNSRGQGTRTFLLVAEDEELVGYFALTPHAFTRTALPRTVSRGSPDPIPGYLLAKLAIDERQQGSGLGSELLLAALAHIVAAARQAGGKVVAVDAIDERAGSFYRRHDFIDAAKGRLVMKISTAAKHLGLPWP